ncbi:BTAD domain-containing putative transcriptional regulator [Roseisolibacter sp. H3M3-2]|uniref:BTAD domain-containing putative transcriptional regulator n=1 Tax=Roseisolibacter sp. H3M3-2 TaxID=3031323 RepID=UPI0023D98FCF|nr:BTAD domain-containing putative transcriptional regulator [Roseisolibacter sp. H3M3-2]MDF1503060.1 BTAD domain-containing putative transcriptional regulator [Roseisolibacter sp. H3M3-2]
MLTLTTLGGLALAADGREVGSVATQRRPMALLAILAAAGDAAVSRERLAALLWPDAEPERARRSVAQAVYTLRRATGLEQVVVGTTALQLNGDLIASDLADFRTALAGERLDDAVAAYRGPFLEGFYLPGGAVDFERWAEGERDRLAHEYARALTALARRAEAAGDLAESVSARRRLVALDPLDSGATLTLVDALARAGDVAGALRAARVHETLLAQELELAPPRELRERVAALQTASGPPVVAPPPPTVATPAPEPAASVPGPPPVVEAPVVVAAPPTRARRWRTARRLAVAAVVGGVLVGGTVLGRRLLAPAAPAPRPVAPLRANVLAVVPFAIDSADPALRDLGEGVADALARMLDAGEGGPRAVDPGTVFAAVERLAGTAPAGRQVALDAGRAVGAGEVVAGRIVGDARRLSLVATLLDVPGGGQRALASVAGPLDSLPVLLERVATQVVAGRALGRDRRGAIGDVSLPVLRAYLGAEAAVRDDRIDDALRLYQRALDGDSTFAPAALGLAEAADRFNGAEQHDRGLALAWAGRDRLAERDRAWLTALAGPRYPAPSPASEQLAAWERAVAVAPDRASAWSELGERLLHDGRMLGLRTADQRAEAAFRRALALDPEYAPALRSQIELAALRGDTATLGRIAAPEQVRRVGGDLTGYLLWRVAVVRGDSALLAGLRPRLPSLGTPSLRAIAMAAQHTGLGRGDGERALRALGARAALAAEQFDVLLAEHSLALGEGRPVRALDVTERLEDAQPWSRAHLRLRVLDALYGDGDSTAAAAAAATLARVVDGRAERQPDARALQLADLCVLTQWRVAQLRGPRPAAAQVAPVRAAVASLRRAELPRVVVPVGVTPPACAELLEAQLAVVTGAPDARRRVEQLDALMLTGPAIGDARTYAHIAVARLFRRVGAPERALAAVRQRAYLRGWPRYLAPSVEEEARLALSVGDSAAARTAAASALLLGAEPEEALRARTDSLRALARPRRGGPG